MVVIVGLVGYGSVVLCRLACLPFCYPSQHLLICDELGKETPLGRQRLHEQCGKGKALVCMPGRVVGEQSRGVVMIKQRFGTTKTVPLPAHTTVSAGSTSSIAAC